MAFINKNITSSSIDKDISYLFELASIFRRAIIECDPVSFDVTLSNFPYGACGDASLLLAKYFENNKCGKFDYVLGNRDGWSHAWLQNGSIIIDITADQFDDQDLPVIVSRDHTWHLSFNGEIEYVADFNIFDCRTSISYKRMYNLITAKINT